MSIKAVLFDLDGTLLPLDQNEFIKGYAPMAEVIEIDGDQDVYSYIISLE